MFPDLFSIGPLTIHTYGLFVALGFVAGIAVTIWLGKSHGMTPQQIMDMGFIIILSGIIGSRLAYILMNFSFYKGNPVEMIRLWNGGLVFSGGLIAVVFAMIWYARHHGLNILEIGDLWSPAAAIGQSLGRVGCFMAGCCYGRPTDIPWSVTFTNPKSLALLNIPIHPAQLYSSLLNLIIFIALLILTFKKTFKGQVFLWFLILHSTARLLLERFRGDDRGFILGTNWTTTQLMASLILLASVVALFVIKTKNERDTVEKK